MERQELCQAGDQGLRSLPEAAHAIQLPQGLRPQPGCSPFSPLCMSACNGVASAHHKHQMTSWVQKSTMQ